MKLSPHAFLSTLSLITLAACSGNTVKQTLGIETRAPDEFRVVSRPPLSVPPQFSLRPPNPTASSPSETSANQRAESLVLGDPHGVPADTSSKPVTSKTLAKSSKGDKSTTAAESNFLNHIGAASADPEVKQKLAEEKVTTQVATEDQSWWSRIFSPPANKEPVVKADAEADRIKKDKQEGKPITEGKTAETGGGPISMIRHWLGDD